MWQGKGATLTSKNIMKWARDTAITSPKGLQTHVDQILKQRVKTGQGRDWGQGGGWWTGRGQGNTVS